MSLTGSLTARRIILKRTLLALLLTSVWTCAGSPSAASATAQTGTWGGTHIALDVAATSAHLEFDCAHADIATAFTLDGNNAFDLTGTYVREHGGPIRPGTPPDSHPASFTGTVSRDRMTLTVRLTDSGDAMGTFALVHGSPGEVFKCL